VLSDAVLELAAPRPGERAVDLYSGVGLFSAGLALRVGTRGRVLAVESEAQAVRDARRNLHDLAQVELLAGRVEQVLPQAVSQPPWSGTADVVVLDPPRSGAGRGVVARIAGLRPRVIVYVACDPASLARDVALFAERGYRTAVLRGYDAFPMTHHVECVVGLVPDPGDGSLDIEIE